MENLTEDETKLYWRLTRWMDMTMCKITTEMALEKAQGVTDGSRLTEESRKKVVDEFMNDNKEFLS